jgi:AbrB family looped-hinge helix DNA binding protein
MQNYFMTSPRPMRPHSTALRSRGVVTIPQQVREQLNLLEGDSLLVGVEDGRIVLTPAALLPRDQTWFWTPEWQAGEREADEDIAAGRGAIYHSGEEFIAAMKERAKPLSDPSE